MAPVFVLPDASSATKQNLITTYLRKAEQLGLNKIANIQAKAIIPLNNNGHYSEGPRNINKTPFNYQVNACSNLSGEKIQIFTKILILAAGTVGTAILLLNSKNTAHMTGSCRMADDISQGVVDVNGEMFNQPGLFITDGATIPSSLAVNPYLTILANAERLSNTITGMYSRN